jgi:hypothetical protein
MQFLRPGLLEQTIDLAESISPIRFERARVYSVDTFVDFSNQGFIRWRLTVVYGTFLRGGRS